MSTFLSVVVGIGIGLATSIIAWFFTMLLLSPRVAIKGEIPDAGAEPKSTYKVLVASRRRSRSMIDVKVTCDLHIPHHGNEENVLTLQISSGFFASVPPKWARVITVSMDPATLTEYGHKRLNERVAELNPPKKRSDIVSLIEIFDLMPMARIDVAVLASDPISGVRSVSRESLRPQSPS
jgi:hypothetical protein